jgi:hypothetical protein
MEFVIWVQTRVAGRTADIKQVASVERPGGIKAPEEIGLSLADGKAVIRDIQRRIVEMQFQVESKLSRLCLNCHSSQRIKDSRPRSFRTVFGVIKVTSNRYLRCS